MVVIDTSAWVELLAETATGLRLRDLWPSNEDIIAPTLVQLELAKWARRVSVEDEFDTVLAYLQVCTIVDLDTRIALLGADLSVRHKLATADAVIYATAVALGAELLTCDAHFDGLTGVNYIPKAGGG